MKRDWLTLAFGVVLVAAVVALSLRQNATRSDPAPGDASNTATPSAPAAAPTAPPDAAATPEEPEAAAPAARPRARAAAPPPAAPAAEPPRVEETGVTLQVQSDVPGASVFLDREFVGTTPLTLRNLAPGSRRLNVTATGHEGYADVVELTPGSNRVNVEFQRVRLNASIPVVHRHAMGSCQGTLTATVKGLTYDTTNRSDQFSLGMADVDAFEVDYLKKNLRVRRREGKTWNFTNDSADVLFVFHRDVAKARDRLLAGSR